MIRMATELTQARLRELLHYDPETGVFTRLVTTGIRSRAGAVAGYVSKALGYRLISIDYTRYYEHRLAWLYMTGAWPGEVDHKDGDGLNNRWNNLRDVTHAVNNQNRREAVPRKKSGLPMGVWRDSRRGTLHAGVRVNGRHHYLGTFETPEDGHAAFVEAKRLLHEGCTI